MAIAKTQPSVPVFVSSTFTDMQTYRRKVQDALTQLETIVRGMEQFGSKPGSPVDECIQVVRSCRLYSGVFGMLQALKDHLKKRHVVSFFTSPEDLQARITHDVPAQLDQIGIEVSGGLANIEKAGELEVLNGFSLLPKLFSGRQITVEFIMRDVNSAATEDCSTLHLEIGATVVCYNVPIVSSGKTLHIYGERNIALSLLSISAGFIVTARASTAFGERMEVDWTDDGPIPVQRSEKGLAITEILGTRPPS